MFGARDAYRNARATLTPFSRRAAKDATSRSAKRARHRAFAEPCDTPVSAGHRERRCCQRRDLALRFDFVSCARSRRQAAAEQTTRRARSTARVCSDTRAKRHLRHVFRADARGVSRTLPSTFIKPRCANRRALGTSSARVARVAASARSSARSHHSRCLRRTPRPLPRPYRPPPEWQLESLGHTTHCSGRSARTYLASNFSEASLLKVIVKITFDHTRSAGPWTCSNSLIPNRFIAP